VSHTSFDVTLMMHALNIDVDILIYFYLRGRVLVTGREIWLPPGNRISRAPPGNRHTEQKISSLFEFF
jgi:hypothetical protein